MGTQDRQDLAGRLEAGRLSFGSAERLMKYLGVIPGAVVASILQRDFASMSVTRIGSAVRPTLVTEPPPSVSGRRVLLVDETCDSGDTLKLALSAVKKAGKHTNMNYNFFKYLREVARNWGISLEFDN